MNDRTTKRVLIIDPDMTTLSDLERHLRRNGWMPRRAIDASTGLSSLNREKTELVICEAELPDCDPIALIGRIKEANPDTDIIVTGRLEALDLPELLDAGAADVVFKPIAPHELARSLLRLEHNQQRLKRLIQNNRDLKQALDRANATYETRNVFLAELIHEIRAPVSGVIGFTEMILDTRLDDNQLEHARAIKMSGESLLSVADNLLDFTRIEAGELDIEAIEFDPELIAYDVCELMRPRVREKPVEILCHIADNVPSLLVGDPLRFRQVLTNLMQNATKFTDAGEVELSLQVAEESNEKVCIHAIVRDTGIGIVPEKLSEIFQPFQQAGQSTLRKYGGTGLGLSICKKISSLMNGDVWAESNTNQGSTFHFTAWFGISPRKSSSPNTRGAIAGKRILIIDDNRASLDILSHLLTSAGLQTVTLRNPEDAFSALREGLSAGEPFDACLTDIQMPGITGIDLAHRIRASESQLPQIPLIALSSRTNRDAKRCEEAGFNGFLSKPIRRKKLFQMLDQLIGNPVHIKEQKNIATQYSVREDQKHSVRILLAEDNPVNQRITELMLSKGGYRTETVSNGRQAVAVYSASPENYDLIFMDVQMPETDGLEAARMLRNRGYSQVPIIALTAYAGESDREKCFAAGMNDFITKPITREKVYEKLEEWIFSEVGE